MSKPIALVAELVPRDFLDGTADRAANPLDVRPTAKTTNVGLVSAGQLVASPENIVTAFRRPDLDELTDFTAPRGIIGDKSYIMNAFVALIICVIMRHLW